MWVTVDRETARHTGRPGRHIRAQFVEAIALGRADTQASLSTATDLRLERWGPPMTAIGSQKRAGTESQIDMSSRQ